VLDKSTTLQHAKCRRAKRTFFAELNEVTVNIRAFLPDFKEAQALIFIVQVNSFKHDNAFACKSCPSQLSMAQKMLVTSW
jgi:hypothetical protein